LRRAAEALEPGQELVGGWCLGSEQFRAELLAQINQRPGGEHYGAEIRQSAQAKAERLVREELSRLGWRERDLEAQRKGAPEKVAIGSRLRKETTMTLAWIAQRLQMGTKTHLSHLLYWQGRKGRA
jgi:hypothetical protein